MLSKAFKSLEALGYQIAGHQVSSDELVEEIVTERIASFCDKVIEKSIRGEVLFLQRDFSFSASLGWTGIEKLEGETRKSIDAMMVGIAERAARKGVAVRYSITDGFHDSEGWDAAKVRLDFSPCKVAP